MAQRQTRGLLEDNKTNATVDELLDRRSKPATVANAEGPTSFAGLIPAPPAAGDNDGQRSQVRRLKTFQDVATAKQKPQQPNSLIQLEGTDWLPPAVHLGRQNSTLQRNDSGTNNYNNSSLGRSKDSKTISAADAKQLELANTLPPSDEAPMDWSIRNSVRFSSPVPFDIWHDARMTPKSDVIQAHRAFTGCASRDALSLRQQMLAACLTWQFPVDTSKNAADGGGNSHHHTAFNPQRWMQWTSGLCSLYEMLRCGACDAFYVVFRPGSKQSTNGARRPPVAFFRVAGVGGHRRIHAMITRSTPGLRALLQQSSVGYTTPLVSGQSGSSKNNNKRKAAGADAKTQQQQQQALNTNRGLLYFEGALRVHGLFELLLNRGKDLRDEGADVPLLLAPVQFTNGVLKNFQLETVGSSKPRNGVPAMHQLLLHGPDIPAWVVDRLLSVLCISQMNQPLTMMCDPYTDSLTLNWHPSIDDDTDMPNGSSNRRSTDYAAREGGCIDMDEANRWRTSVEGLSTRAIRELKCSSDGQFTATKLTSKLA